MAAKKKVELIFEKDPNYRRVRLTNFFGGISPYGELVFDAIEEVPIYPDKIIQNLDDEGMTILGEERMPAEGGVTKIKRIQYLGITMPIEAVPGIIKWMEDKLEQYAKVKENRS